MNTDFLFGCRVCQSPLLASGGDRGAIVDCPNCGGSQTIPADPTFGANPSSYLSDVALLGDPAHEHPNHRSPILRRVRLQRDSTGATVRAPVAADLSALPTGAPLPEDPRVLQEEIAALRSLVADQNRQLMEWQTCHESVDRELKRASERAAALQSKINGTANDLAQTRHELAKARAETDAARKANETLNRQLQGIIMAGQTRPPTVAAPTDPPAKRKSAPKTSGEMAA